MMTSEPMTERESMIQIYSDFHKDAYGFRPRGINYDAMTLAELKADFASFAEICESNEKQEKEANERVIASFEARLQSVIDMGAGDRETALRWMMESFDTHEFDYGIEGFVTYTLGMGYTDFARELAVELQPILQPRIDEYFAEMCAERYADVA
jgi:hypothetical protein